MLSVVTTARSMIAARYAPVDWLVNQTLLAFGNVTVRCWAFCWRLETARIGRRGGFHWDLQFMSAVT